MERDWKTIAQGLTKEFPENSVHTKIQSYTKRKENGEYPDGTKGMKVSFINARDVMNRLDETVGPDNWSDSYVVHPNHVVQCELTVLGVTKSDVGYPNGDNDAEPLKSAFSDAFKRAAVKFGVGRFLYEMDPIFVSVDKYGHEIKNSTRQANAQPSGNLQQNNSSKSNGPNPVQVPDKDGSQMANTTRGDVSEAQLKLIRDKTGRKEGGEEIVREYLESNVGKGSALEGLNKRQASALIDLLR